MTEIIASIKPHYTQKIFSGEKRIEMRKSEPNCNWPFKVFMYETKGNGGKGAVVGEFIVRCTFAEKYPFPAALTASACINSQALNDYAADKIIHSWYISDAKQYQKVKSLKEFGLNRAPQSWCYIKHKGD